MDQFGNLCSSERNRIAFSRFEYRTSLLWLRISSNQVSRRLISFFLTISIAHWTVTNFGSMKNVNQSLYHRPDLFSREKISRFWSGSRTNGNIRNVFLQIRYNGMAKMNGEGLYESWWAYQDVQMDSSAENKITGIKGKILPTDLTSLWSLIANQPLRENGFPASMSPIKRLFPQSSAI